MLVFLYIVACIDFGGLLGLRGGLRLLIGFVGLFIVGFGCFGSDCGGLVWFGCCSVVALILRVVGGG